MAPTGSLLRRPGCGFWRGSGGYVIIMELRRPRFLVHSVATNRLAANDAELLAYAAWPDESATFRNRPAPLELQFWRF